MCSGAFPNGPNGSTFVLRWFHRNSLPLSIAAFTCSGVSPTPARPLGAVAGLIGTSAESTPAGRVCGVAAGDVVATAIVAGGGFVVAAAGAVVAASAGG